MFSLKKAAITVALAGAAALAPLAPAAATTAAPDSVQAKCGFQTYYVQSTKLAYYYHCGSTTVMIHVDVPGQGSANDYNYCSKAWEVRNFGLSGNVLNAYYIGGAGCRP